MAFLLFKVQCRGGREAVGVLIQISSDLGVMSWFTQFRPVTSGYVCVLL